MDVTEVAEILADVLADAGDRTGLAEEGVETAASLTEPVLPEDVEPGLREEGVDDGIVSSAGFVARRLPAETADGFVSKTAPESAAEVAKFSWDIGFPTGIETECASTKLLKLGVGWVCIKCGSAT